MRAVGFSRSFRGSMTLLIAVSFSPRRAHTTAFRGVLHPGATNGTPTVLAAHRIPRLPADIDRLWRTVAYGVAGQRLGRAPRSRRRWQRAGYRRKRPLVPRP